MIFSNNDSNRIYSQLSYKFRKLNFLATYWRVNQLVSSSGLPRAIRKQLLFHYLTMVQRLLDRARPSSKRIAAWGLVLILLLPAASFAKDKAQLVQAPPDLLLEGGRKLTFERVLTSERDIRGPKGFFKKLVDVVAGEADLKPMVRPYSVAVDSRGRVIVTDPGLHGIHVFDPAEHKYKFLDREDKGKNSTLLEPQCVAVDASDNIYVTDSVSGKIFLWAANGKYKGVFGNLKGGEGFFKRPTGIAIDRDTHEIYVTDTLRDRIYVLDEKGQTIRTIGQRGGENGEFNFPTEILSKNGVLAVVDAMNFRVQTFDAKGPFKARSATRETQAAPCFGRRV